MRELSFYLLCVENAKFTILIAIPKIDILYATAVKNILASVVNFNKFRLGKRK